MLALAAALILAVTPGQSAVVRVPVANVWEAPNAGHLPLDPHVWPTPAVTYSQRIALVGHMPTQVLYGEQVRVLEQRGGWTHIAVPDQPSPLDRRGYPGLGPLVAARPGRRSEDRADVVTARTAKLANGTEVGFGSEVPSARCPPPRRGRCRARAPISSRTAKQFLGLHYLWGGLSAWGYDCSGLTWAVYRAHGITIPRDADAQFAAGTPVALSTRAARRPALLRASRSSATSRCTIGGGQMIEAPNSRSEVRIVPIRTSDFRGARRFF